MTQTTGTSTCPTWCVSLHLDGETLHYSQSVELALSRRPTAGERLFRPALPAAPITLELITHQETGEPEPWIAVLHEGTALLDLTAESAARFGTALQELAADAAR